MDAHVWRLVTLGVAASTAAVLAVAPVVSRSSCSMTGPAGSSCTSGHESLLATEGPSVLVVLVVPLVIALFPVVARTRRATVASASLLTFVMLVALASIGLYFLPTVVLAWAAVRASSASDVDHLAR